MSRHGAVVASPRQAALDCLRVLPARLAQDLVHRCVQQGLLKVRDLQGEVLTLKGYRQVGQLRAMTRAVLTNAHSAPEEVFHRLLQSAGLSDWVANLWVRLDGDRFCIDIAFPELKLAIEYDSPFTHSQPTRLAADRKKWNALNRHGWEVLNYTWEQIIRHGDATISEILFFLEKRQRLLG